MEARKKEKAVCNYLFRMIDSPVCQVDRDCICEIPCNVIGGLKGRSSGL